MDTLRVLVVDDELGMRHSIKRALRDYHIDLPDVDGQVRFELETAERGEQALEILEHAQFDLMLLDHKLGGMTGVDVLETLQGRELDMLVIMITAFATIETAVRATKSGAFDFIAKPFTPDELKATVRKAASHLVVQRQARRLAEEKRRVRFDFIRVLGHELKSPLAAIESYLDLMKNRVAGNELSSYDHVVERLLARSAGMRKLIVDLLDMTRIEAGEKRRELTAVDVEEAAQGALDGVRLQADARNITLKLACEGATTMRADRGEVDILLNNLVSNAVKYNRAGGAVDVHIGGDDERIKITVRDTGIGLSKEECARLFNDFTRIKNEKTRDIEGSGLGLSIVKKIAELYRGSVRVASEPDVGSTFTLVLRRDAAPPEAAHAATGTERLDADA
jgi:two-component system sensor histidine kinase/response regulator